MNKLVIYYLFLIFLGFYDNAYGQQGRTWNALLNVSGSNVPIYKDESGKKIAYTIKNDTIKEIYFQLKIVDKKNNFFKVETVSTALDAKIRVGWIRVKYVGTYFSNGVYRKYQMYNEPNRKSISRIISYQGSGMVSVLGISGTWVKVSFLVKGIIFSGWIPSKMLCPDPFGSCT